MMRPMVFALVLAAFSFVGLGSRGAAALDLHVAPGGTGDGSAASPFGTLDAALGAASDGDRVVLHEGDYGDALLMGVFGSETTVVVASGEQARFRSVEIRATHLTFRGATVSLSYGDPYETRTMVAVHGSSASVTVADCDIFSVTDGVAAGWGAADWANLPGTGVSVRAPDTTISNNRVRNVGHGISVAHDAPNAIVRGNHIDGFSRDGLRGIGDYGLFEYNVVRNAYDVDDHHDDFFQSWSVGADGTPGEGVVRGVVLRGNFFINFDDPARPFAGQAQGIGCFDGFFEDWVVENNVVIVDHWHGITFLGARNLRIVNNTVLDNRPGDGPGPPWIRIDDHKDGTRSSGGLVRNNLSTSIQVGVETTEDHNLLIDDTGALFEDVANHDLHLRPTATDAIDVGSSEAAPAFDLDRIPRPQGAATDLGAYEWHDGSASPVDGGPTGPAVDGGAPTDAGGADAAPPADGGSASMDGGLDGGGESSEGGCSATRVGVGGSSARLALAGSLLFLFFSAVGRRRRR